MEIRAEEARDLTDKKVDEIMRNELDRIFREIINAINSGKYSINFYEPICNSSKTRLENLGYKIKDNYNQKDGYDYKISWGWNYE